MCGLLQGRTILPRAREQFLTRETTRQLWGDRLAHGCRNDSVSDTRIGCRPAQMNRRWHIRSGLTANATWMSKWQVVACWRIGMDQ